MGISDTTAGVNIKDAKTEQNQFVPIENKAIIKMLKVFLAQRRLSPLTKVFSLSYGRYLKLIKDIASELGLGDKPVTTHSTRMGGAVYAYSSKTSAKYIAITGRLESVKSLRRYLTNGRGWLMNLQLCEASQKRISELKGQFKEFFGV